MNSSPPIAPTDIRQGRSRRKRAVRAHTINMRRASRRDLEVGQLLYPVEEHEPLPETRGECIDGPRPCPLVRCKYNLYLDVHPTSGSIKLNFPDLEVWELQHSCTLDIADEGGATLDRTGEAMNLTRERVRQLEIRARDKLRRYLPLLSGSL